MRFKFFAVAAQAPEEGEAALNAFCAGHRVASVERNLVAAGAQSFWAVCVTGVEGARAAESTDGKGGKAGRVDYREILSDTDFNAYAALRLLRKATAERDGLPTYAVFTNEQLAAMVTGRVADLAALGRIEGVGASRIERLLALLARRFKGEGFLRLMRRIVVGCPATPGKGLPIGSLTSQHCANLYLDGADRWLQASPLVCASVRYMDDMLWWCADRAAAHRTRAGLEAWLAQERALNLKPGPGIGRSVDGVTWCGARVLPGTVRLTARRRRRYAERRHAWEAAFAAGAIDGCALQRGYDAVLSQTLSMDALSWRREQLRRVPTAYDGDG